MTRSGMVEGNSMIGGPRKTVVKARRLRRTMSPPEVILWHRLRHRPGGFKCRRQHPAGSYVLDFFCSEAKLVIEVDGIAHDFGDRPLSDQVRDKWLEEQNVAVLRIGAGDVTRTPEQVIEWIVARCVERGNPLHRSSSGPPPRSGEETP